MAERKQEREPHKKVNRLAPRNRVIPGGGPAQMALQVPTL
jgi:hypothetical protein